MILVEKPRESKIIQVGFFFGFFFLGFFFGESYKTTLSQKKNTGGISGIQRIENSCNKVLQLY